MIDALQSVLNFVLSIVRPSNLPELPSGQSVTITSALSVSLTDFTALQVFQEASEHLPGLHPRDRLHVHPVWLPRSAGLLQVDSL